MCPVALAIGQKPDLCASISLSVVLSNFSRLQDLIFNGQTMNGLVFSWQPFYLFFIVFLAVAVFSLSCPEAQVGM